MQDAWHRGQPLSLHGWIYGLSDGLVKDLGIDAGTPAKLEMDYAAAIAGVCGLGRCVIRLEHVTKTFPGPRPRTVLERVSLEVPRGQWLAILGESGVGKSTLLNLIAGLERADAGRSSSTASPSIAWKTTR